MYIVKWLYTSSADPKKISLAVKGIMLSFAPLLMLVFGWTDAEVANLGESFGNVVFFALSAVSAGQVIYGLFRKAKLGRWAASE